MDSIDLAQDQWRALVNKAMNLRVKQKAGKFLNSYTTGGFSRRAQLHEVSLDTTDSIKLKYMNWGSLQ
jgi:hypothetical protein